jgi:DNA polymerase III, gamma/tau subunits
MFNDIVGHESPKAILQAAMKNDRIAHAYLFHGEERIGKRFTAMRFAKRSIARKVRIWSVLMPVASVAPACKLRRIRILTLC